MDDAYRDFLLRVLEAFAKSENRIEDYVQQQVRLAVIPESVRLDREPDETVALSAEGIWDQDRWFDYGDGPGEHACQRKLQAKLRMSSEPITLPAETASMVRCSVEEFIGAFAGGQIAWRQPGVSSAPHWLARRPMPVPARFDDLRTERPHLWLWTDNGETIA